MAAITSIINETPSRLTLVNIDDEQMVLAPLQEKEVSPDSGFDFEDLERKGTVRTRKEAPRSVSDDISVTVLGGGFWLAIIAGGVATTEPKFGISAATWPYAVWGTGLLIFVGVVSALIIRGTNSRSLVVRWTMNAMSLAVILAIGLGLPGATIYFFGGGRELLATAPPGSVPPLALFARLIQLALIATASLLPVLLFFLFDRYQLSTLRKTALCQSVSARSLRLDHQRDRREVRFADPRSLWCGHARPGTARAGDPMAGARVRLRDDARVDHDTRPGG